MGQTPPAAAFPTTVVRCFSKEADIYMGQHRETEGEGLVSHIYKFRHICNICHMCYICPNGHECDIGNFCHQ